MQAIMGIVFLLSGYNNGADLTIGFGFPEEQNIFLAPVGIIEVSTPLYSGELTKLTLGISHYSSIPDARDNFNSAAGTYSYSLTPENNLKAADLNMLTIKYTVRFIGAK